MINAKQVSQLKGKLSQITLRGPAISRKTVNTSFNQFVAYRDHIAEEWRKQCQLSCPFGCWAVSSTIGTTSLLLHYWFEDRRDALLFKLMMRNFE